MATPFMIGVADGLELQGGVRHVEVAGQAVLQVIEHPARLALR